MARVIKVMEEYDLTKEDWDSVIELGQLKDREILSLPSHQRFVHAGP